jgi:hypothetical protein
MKLTHNRMDYQSQPCGYSDGPMIVDCVEGRKKVMTGVGIRFLYRGMRNRCEHNLGRSWIQTAVLVD